jgi:hypothetical protein
MIRAVCIPLSSGPILLGLLLLARPCPAEEPLTLFGGRLSLGGEMSGAYGSHDRGYFNNTDYGTNNLRLFRLDLAAEVRAGAHVGAAADVRTDNLGKPRAYALYLRLRPWRDRPLDLQAGQIPTVFGAFPRRRYLLDNPLIGTPLAYQYLTSLRSDVVPRSADDLALRRGLGWLVPYPDAPTPLAPGLPLVNAERWDTGVQVRWAPDPFQVAVSVTQGTLSEPRFHDNNAGKQVSGRVGWKPLPGFTVGVSGAIGPYLTRSVTDALPANMPRRYDQKVLGMDVEWASGYWIVRGEAVLNAWEVPALEAPFIDSPLLALGLMLEARYKIMPGLYVAARADRLHFSSIETSHGALPWDAPVTRVEAGVGYSLHRYVLLKAIYQYNRRDGGFTRREANLAAGQILVWF